MSKRTHPGAIWAADGETPYYYEDGEDRPATAARYTLSETYADVLAELDEVSRERDRLRQELDGVLKMIGDAPRECPRRVDGCVENCGDYGCNN